MRSLADAQPLTAAQFVEMVVKVQEMYTGTEYLSAMSYEQYLERRKVLVEALNASNLGACCMKDPTHVVHNVWSGGSVSITENAVTGEEIETDSSGDVMTTCQEDKEDPTDYACNWEEYEQMVNAAAYTS